MASVITISTNVKPSSLRRKDPRRGLMDDPEDSFRFGHTGKVAYYPNRLSGKQLPSRTSSRRTVDWYSLDFEPTSASFSYRYVRFKCRRRRNPSAAWGGYPCVDVDIAVVVEIAPAVCALLAYAVKAGARLPHSKVLERLASSSQLIRSVRPIATSARPKYH